MRAATTGSIWKFVAGPLMVLSMAVPAHRRRAVDLADGIGRP